MQVQTILTITDENKDTVMAALERLVAVGAIPNYEIEDIKNQIRQLMR